MAAPQPFPPITLDHEGNDANPAIQLFGRRFFTDQTIMEFLVELLLLCQSPKQLYDTTERFSSALPPWEQIQGWPKNTSLAYLPPVRLALKLFSLLAVSKLETRHPSHIQQHAVIRTKLLESMKVSGGFDKEEVLTGLANLMLGFQGVGHNRTWCAQTFFPLSKTLVMKETLWNETVARRAGDNLSWQDIISQFKKYFSVGRHRFMARGGELLYLQLCNAFREHEQFQEFIEDLDLTAEERQPQSLHTNLEQNLRRITEHAPPALDRIALLIDEIDETTAQATNREYDLLHCGWCPSDSWREGYLFAVEVNRLCAANIDPIERIDLLMLGCALQVLRSLCAQSARYLPQKKIKAPDKGGALGFAWIISDPQGKSRTLNQLSQRNLQVVQKVIQQALRNEDIANNVSKHASKQKAALYKEADERYGHKLFVSLAKKLGFIVPLKGPGTRFILDDKMVRYLVLALIPPGERRTFDDFKASLYAHYGMALEGDELKKACEWSDLPKLFAAGVDEGPWLADMLKASGFLIHLSDACSLVHNPFSQ